MDYTKYDKPEVGRGCTFGVNEVGEPCAKEARGCFRLHEEPWLAEYPDNFPTDIFEVRFKNTRRSFYQNVNNLQLEVGDIVAVEASPGHDIGIISLSGDMVARQMRRLGFNPQNGEFKKIYRKARPYDIEKWQEAIALEHETMIRSRQIAADMGLDMKIGDVEYQGDKIKAIFYYIADGRVDFRELIKVFAEQFHIRIEMKQIGARQEAGRIGGIGACGRELCCASWVSSFSSVTTGAARVQDLSLNPQKLAGQCSKLKCCLTYEYDVYADARRSMPRLREPLQTLEGEFFLVKSDILAHTMTFSSSKESWSNLVTLPVSRVREILAANRNGEKVDSLHGSDFEPQVEEPTYRTEEDSITRFDKAKKRKKKRNKQRNEGDNAQPTQSATPQSGEQQDVKPQGSGKHHKGKHHHHHNHKKQE
jgi:cell fate regulator YaaT (PSP1 superfamily)